MATREELMQALRNADAAGDVEGARRLAAMLDAASPQNREAQVSAEFEQLPWYLKPVQAADDIVRKTVNGITVGYADKLASYMNGTPIEEERQRSADAGTRAGSAGTVAEIGGMALPMLAAPAAVPAVMARVPAAAGATGRLLAGGTAAAAEGSAWGALEASGHDRDIVDGAIDGAILGPLAQGAGNLIGRSADAVARTLFKNPNRLSVPELATAKDAAYQKVSDMGVEYTPQTVQGILGAVDSATPRTRVYPGRHNETIAAKRQVRNNLGGGRARSLSEVDLNRQIVKDDVAGLIADPVQASTGQDIVKAMDDYLDTVGKSGVTSRSGSPEAGLAALKDARGLNSRMRKTQELTKAVTDAERAANKNLQSGIDSTLKSNVEGILKHPKRRAGYTPDEIEAMESLVQGTLGERFTRQVARMAPGGGMSLGGMGIGGAAGTLFGPMGTLAGAILPSTVGTGAKKIAERTTRRKSDELLTLVSSGSKKAAKQAKVSSPEAQDALAKFLMSMGLSE